MQYPGRHLLKHFDNLSENPEDSYFNQNFDYRVVGREIFQGYNNIAHGYRDFQDTNQRHWEIRCDAICALSKVINGRRLPCDIIRVVQNLGNLNLLSLHPIHHTQSHAFHPNVSIHHSKEASS